MPTAKTAKRSTTTAPKKTTKTTTKVPAKKAVAPAKASTAEMPGKKSSSMTASDLQKKVMDPKNRRSLLLALGVIGLGLIIFFGRGLLIAATVNGQPISRLSIIRDLEQQSGKASLDAVITRALVFQEANKKKVTASDQDINNEIAKIKKQFEAQGQNLDQLLLTQGLSQEKFKEEVKVQILVQKILGDQAKVTDKEFNDFLSKNKELVENEKDQVTAKAALRTQMEQQKLAQKYQEWIATVKKNAKVNYLVNY
jgi:parvulin-like peptidyl-prolyl isomerase